MNEIERKILAAMQEEGQRDTVSEEQANTLQLIGKSFKGTFKLIFFAVVTLQLIFAAAGVYCLIELFAEPSLGVKFHWLVGVVAALVVFTALRLWMFMEINRLSVLREIKRVELQLAIIASSIKQP